MGDVRKAFFFLGALVVLGSGSEDSKTSDKKVLIKTEAPPSDLADTLNKGPEDDEAETEDRWHFHPSQHEDEEGSGFRSFMDSDDDDLTWPEEVTLVRKGSSQGTVNDDAHSKGHEKKDRYDNETHRITRHYFCNKTCEKSCPDGYQISG